MTDHVTVSLDGGVLTLTLNRPEKKNALTDAMYGALADGLERAAADPAVRGVVLQSAGDAFTAGNDVMDFAAAAAEGARAFGDLNVYRFLKGLAKADKPVVAAVQGFAVGIGLTMLLHCDLVYVAEDARLSAPFVNLALVPEAASSLLLPARIGHGRAFTVFAMGETLDGRQAVALGLATAAVPSTEVRARAAAAARELAGKPLGALMATKRLMRDAALLSAQMDREGKVFDERLRTAEAREAFAAFAERRAPNFAAVAAE